MGLQGSELWLLAADDWPVIDDVVWAAGGAG